MNGVDNNRNTNALRSQPSENSGFAAVCVDDVRFLFAQGFLEFFQREHVFERVDWANKFRNNG